MFKKPPRTGPFSSALQRINERLSAWNNAHIIPGQDPDFIRRDDHGNIISYTHYGNFASEYGWEIEREDIGLTDQAGLRPLHVSRVDVGRDTTRYSPSGPR